MLKIKIYLVFFIDKSLSVLLAILKNIILLAPIWLVVPLIYIAARYFAIYAYVRFIQIKKILPYYIVLKHISKYSKELNTVAVPKQTATNISANKASAHSYIYTWDLPMISHIRVEQSIAGKYSLPPPLGNVQHCAFQFDQRPKQSQKVECHRLSFRGCWQIWQLLCILIQTLLSVRNELK